ncbi:MAG: aminotransferase class V-fold PLP-dependent enzyme, partial [Deltaproteobacteria bacterium]
MSLPEPTRREAAFPIEAVRAEFPALEQAVHGRPLVYLDSAASALKPKAVIDAVTHFYARDASNVHRGVHELSRRATEHYEAARE